MRREGAKRTVSEFVALLKQCRNTRDLRGGKSLHLEAVAAGCHTNRYVATSLINMYTRCGSMSDAREVFELLSHRSVVTWTSLILGYVDNGHASVALELFEGMDCEPDSVTFLAALKACASLASRKVAEKSSSLRRGKLIHEQLRKRELGSDLVVSNALVDMYSKCGSMSEAKTVFDQMPRRDVVSWTCLILGYVENGNSIAALELFNAMDCQPDLAVCVSALKACAAMRNLDKGRAIHERVRDVPGLDSSVVVTNTLVDMYSKCRDMASARGVFDGSLSQNDVTWTCLIHGYVENGQSAVALELFERMDCRPNSVTFLAALKACASLGSENGVEEKQFWLEKGGAIHEQVKSLGFDSDLAVGNTLVDMYGKCGSMTHAQGVFDRLCRPNTVSWNSLLMGYVENGEYVEAYERFTIMSCEPDSVTFVAALKACVGLGADKLRTGMSLHERIKQLGFESDAVVGNTLVDMYSKCRSMARAQDVFLSMTSRSVVSWNCLIHGYVENGECSVALDVFTSMDCEPDTVTFVGALKACASLANRSEQYSDKEVCFRKGVSIHRQVQHRGLHYDTTVSNNLLDMYSKCWSLKNAKEVFDNMSCRNIVSWNSLILAHVETGGSSAALQLFSDMDCQPDSATFVALLKACAALATDKLADRRSALRQGIDIHERVKKFGFDSNLLVVNTLVDMYSKCGSVSGAQEAFDRLMHRNVVTWNSLILGYVENGESSKALDLYFRMDPQPDALTFTAALKAAASLGAQSLGRVIHARICKLELELNVMVANSLIHFYGKCGAFCGAEHVFHGLPSPSIVSWNSLIAGCTLLGDSTKVFSLVSELQATRLRLNSVTLLCILTACSHAGMVDEGRAYLTAMVSRYGVSPTLEHYTCMVDMLGRANRLHEALSLVNDMPLKADAVTWTSLLGACSKWNNRQIGKLAFDSLQQDDPRETAAYVLMGGILSRASR